MPTLIFGGDIAPIRDDCRDLFGELTPTIKAADLAVANLEIALTDKGTPTRGKGITHTGPPEAIAPLMAGGFDCFNMANNHVLDYGEAALLDCRHAERIARFDFRGFVAAFRTDDHFEQIGACKSAQRRNPEHGARRRVLLDDLQGARVQTAGGRIAIVGLVPGGKSIECLDHPQIVFAESRFGDSKSVLVFFVGIRFLTEGHVALEQRIENVELFRIEQTVEIAREVERALKRRCTLEELALGEVGFTEARQWSQQHPVGPGFAPVDDAYRPQVMFLGERVVTATIGDGAQIGEGRYELSCILAELPFGARDQLLATQSRAHEIVRIESRFELQKRFATLAHGGIGSGCTRGRLRVRHARPEQGGGGDQRFSKR
jgi:hypothetical protein